MTSFMKQPLLVAFTVMLGACSLFTGLDGFAEGQMGTLADGGRSTDPSATGDSGGVLADAADAANPRAASAALVIAAGEAESGQLDTVHSAVFLPDGGLGPWQPGPTIPSPQPLYQGTVAVGDTVFFVHGEQTLSAKSTGAGLGGIAFETGESGLYGACTAAMGDTLVAIGSSDDVSPNVRATRPRAGVGWADQPPPPALRRLHGCAASSDSVYLVGGKDSSDIHQSTVYFAKRGANGLPGEWAATTELPATNYEPRAVVLGSYLYVVGAEWDGPLTATSVIYAAIEADGRLGSWQSTAALPKAISAPAVAAQGDRIVVAGGHDWDQRFSDVLVATANPTGGLSSWTRVAAMPVAATRLGSAIVVVP